MSEEDLPMGEPDTAFDVPPEKKKKQWAPGAARNLFFVGGVIVVAVVAAFVLPSLWGKKEKPLADGISNPAIQETKPTQEGTTEHYREVVRHGNEEEAAAAAAAGKSHVPVLIVEGEKAPAAKEVIFESRGGAVAEIPQQQGFQVDRGAPRQVTEEEKNAKERARKAYYAMLEGWSGGGTRVVEWAPRAPAAAASAGGTAGAAPTLAKAPLARKGEIFYATLDSAIDTDSQSVVIATAQGGKFSGARIVGQMTTDYRTVSMTFTLMNHAGKGYQINGIALDESNYRSAVGGEVDNRYFSRIVMPALAAAVAKMGEIAGMPDTATTTNVGSTTTTATKPSTSEIVAAGVGEAAKQASTTLTSDKVNPQVVLPAGAGVGILLLADVLEN